LFILLIPVLLFGFWQGCRGRFQNVDSNLLIQNFALAGLPGIIIVFFVELALSLLIAVLIPEKKNEPIGLAILSAFLVSFLVAALVEESLKLYVARIRPQEQKADLTNYRSWIAGGFAAALGFSVTENLKYCITAATASGPAAAVSLALLRIILSTPLHVITGTIIGIELAKQSNQWFPTWKVLVVPIAVHGTFDFILFVAAVPQISLTDYPMYATPSVIVLVILAIIYSIVKIRKLVNDLSTPSEDDLERPLLQ
jgi:RsiW-degrading membrane proteinase PrsW (M82 family)